MALVLGTKPAERTAAGRTTELVRPLIGLTLIAALAEVTLLRLISRLGVHIPALSWARTLYNAAVAAGEIVFPVATVFAAALLVVLAERLARRAALVTFAILTLLGFEAWLLVTTPDPAASALHAFVLSGALVATLVGAMRTGLPHRPLVFVAFVVAGQCLVEVQSASAHLVALGGRPLPLAWASAGELFFVVALLLLPVLLVAPPWPRQALLAGALATLLTAGMLAGNASTVRILAIWTFGLAMPVLTPLYALAAGTVVATAVALWRAGRTTEACGLALVVLGGFGPPSSYQADLLLAGVVLLAFPQIVERTLPYAARAASR
jgi:hypothetical protein